MNPKISKITHDPAMIKNFKYEPNNKRNVVVCIPTVLLANKVINYEQYIDMIKSEAVG